jgi:hypothetical protein
VPAWVVVNGAELYEPLPETGTSSVNLVVEHVGSFGPCRVNVIVPVGLAPPRRLALSKI